MPPEKRFDLVNLDLQFRVTLLWKLFQKSLQKKNLDLESYPTILAYFVMQMTPDTAPEKKLDLVNLTLQNWPILLCK